MKTRSLHPLLYLILPMCMPLLVRGQSQIQTKFTNFQVSRLQEKVFLHTDKNAYLTGEELQFSIYVIDELLHLPSELSKVAYVDMLDDENTPVAQVKVLLQAGRGHASINIPEIPAGTYTLRSYTRWMKNLSPAFYYHQRVPIVSSTREPSLQTVTQHTDSIYADFFPEGGNLVDGLKSKVAFRITDKNGKGIEAGGTVINTAGDTVASFQTLKFGMGNFFLTPTKENVYSAHIKANGKNFVFALPIAQREGVVMTLNDLNADKLQVIISEQTTKNSGDTILFFAHTRHQTKLVMSTILRDGKGGFLIDKNKLGEGISHLTIFNKKNQPLCERLFFIRPRNPLGIRTAINQENFKIREKVNIDLSTVDSKGKHSNSTLSLSVYKLDAMQSGDVNSIAGYLLLTSDLQGIIESPDYYLSGDNAEITAAIDNLMLTHGWRRFNWKDVLKYQYESDQVAPDYEGMTITGKVTYKGTQKPAPNLLLYLAEPGVYPHLVNAKTDSRGVFEFYTGKIFDQAELVVGPYNEDASNVTIVIDSPFSNQYAQNISLKDVERPASYKDVLTSSIHLQTDAYFRKQRPLKKIQRDSLPFFGHPEKTYLLDDYQRFATVEEIFREYIPEVSILRQEKKTGFFIINKSQQEMYPERPLMLFDGLPMLNAERLLTMNPQQIKRIELITHRYWLGPIMYYGIVNFKTYKGDLNGAELDPDIYVLDFEGLQRQREYLTPRYDTTSRSNRVPDFRTVLYWNPDIKTDSTGTFRCDFFTSDEIGKYLVVVHGLSSEGSSGTSTLTFDVTE